MEPAATLTALLKPLREAYAEEESTRVGAVPGQVTTADWCVAACSQVYVRLESLYRSTQQFPAPDSGADTCGAVMAAVWHIGVWRCVHDLQANGAPPAVEDQTADAVMILEDTCRIREAIASYAAELTSRRGSYQLGRWTPIGPLGACAGGYWTLTTRLGRTA